MSWVRPSREQGAEGAPVVLGQVVKKGEVLCHIPAGEDRLHGIVRVTRACADEQELKEKMMQYRDRNDAGRQLAEKLMMYANRPDVLVLALPRGGVPVGFTVAEVLHTP